MGVGVSWQWDPRNMLGAGVAVGVGRVLQCDPRNMREGGWLTVGVGGSGSELEGGLSAVSVLFSYS